MKDSYKITMGRYRENTWKSVPLKVDILKDLKKKLARVKEEYPDRSVVVTSYLFFLKIVSIAFRLLFARIYLRSCALGNLVTTKGKPLIRNKGMITIGNRVAIWSVFDRTKFFVHRKAILSIGSYSRINGVHISVKNSVTIGKRVRIGPYSLIMDSDFHDAYDRSKEGKVKPVTIGDDVWIASRVIILKGVTIGAGSMIAAGSVITHDIPPKTLAAGVPAKVVRHL